MPWADNVNGLFIGAPINMNPDGVQIGALWRFTAQSKATRDERLKVEATG
jgi:hypothetical protein